MKSLILLIIYFLSVIIVGKSQTKDGTTFTGNFFIVKQGIDIPVQEYDYNLEIPIKNKLFAKQGTIFTIQRIIGDTILIKFWNYKTKEKQNQSGPGFRYLNNTSVYNFVDSNCNNRYFFINTNILNSTVEPYYGYRKGFVWGLAILPVKLRFGNHDNRYFQFSNSFTLGTTAGYQWGFPSKKEVSLSLLGGIGISSINLDSTSTNGFEQKNVNGAAFTPSIGVVYSYQQFQIGIFTGIDYTGGEVSKHWVYQGKPWFSIGLGVAIFQQNKGSETEKLQN